MKRLKAFTIVELSVTLLISGVVMGIAYYAYSLFVAQQKKQLSKSELVQEYFLFRKAMQTDTERANAITDSSGHLVFGSENTVQYNFDKEFVVRSTSFSSDTFYVKCISHEFFMIDENSTLVSAVNVKFDLGKELLNADFKKNYSSRQLLMYE